MTKQRTMSVDSYHSTRILRPHRWALLCLNIYSNCTIRMSHPAFAMHIRPSMCYTYISCVHLTTNRTFDVLHNIAIKVDSVSPRRCIAPDRQTIWDQTMRAQGAHKNHPHVPIARPLLVKLLGR
ncbi:uncharacterized protein B0H18DRAFT_324570 [Fomitopsis serialis]|uniref:uncharacterized protein n=1 Tax=Fomitopsis serialis TaxID=139415 RepID=UPI0020074A2F|nr:uncharacterized protein B0H18DRAFT_324570 [Neoantrodia serialis]KAH9936507.1 hypothetical protein B0H18DRAFT_324570 [Neoantrodia serialis]